MAFNYSQVKSLYDTLKSAGTVTQSLPDWSTEMNRISQSDLYSAGLSDNFVKRGVTLLDNAIEATPLPEWGATLGRAIDYQVGRGTNEFENVGHGLPRMMLDVAPMAIPVVGPWISALLMGTKAYTDTDSIGAGVVAGTVGRLMPSVARMAETAALRALGAESVSGVAQTAVRNGVPQFAQVERFFPTAGQSALKFLAGQAAAAGLMEAGAFGQDIALDQPLHDPFTLQNVANLTLGQLPFAAQHGVSKLVNVAMHGTAKTQRAALEKNIAETSAMFDRQRQLEETKSALAEIAPLYTVPDKVTAEEKEKLLAEHHAMQQKLSGVAQTPETVKQAQATEEKIAALKEVPVVAPTVEDLLTTPQEESVEGRTRRGSAATVEVTGTLKPLKDRPNFSILVVSKAPEGLALPELYASLEAKKSGATAELKEIQPGMQIGFSTKNGVEPRVNPDGTVTVTITPDYASHVIDRPLVGVEERPVVATPDLTITNPEGILPELPKAPRIFSENPQGDLFQQRYSDTHDGLAQLRNTHVELREAFSTFLTDYLRPDIFDAEKFAARDKLNAKLGLLGFDPVTDKKIADVVAMENLTARAGENLKAKAISVLHQQESQKVLAELEQMQTRKLAFERISELEKLPASDPKRQLLDEANRYYNEEVNTTNASTTKWMENNFWSKFYTWEKYGGTDIADFQRTFKAQVAKLKNAEKEKMLPSLDAKVTNGEGDSVTKLDQVSAPAAGESVLPAGKAEVKVKPVAKAPVEPAKPTQSPAEKVLASQLHDLDSNARVAYETKAKAPVSNDEWTEVKQQVMRAYREFGALNEKLTAEEAQDLGEVFAKSKLDNLSQKELENFFLQPHVQMLLDAFKPKGQVDEPFAPPREDATASKNPLTEQLNRPWQPETPGQQALVKDWGFDQPQALSALERIISGEVSPRVKVVAEFFRQFESANKVISFALGDRSFTKAQADGSIRIGLDKALLYMPDELAAREILHEVGHGLLLHEIVNPSTPASAKAGRELEGLRQTLLEQRPDLREALVKAEANGWFARHNEGEARLSELGLSRKDAEVFYALANVKELTAQSYSSKPVQEYLRSVKAPAGSGFKSMLSAVFQKLKALVGITGGQNTMLDAIWRQNESLLEARESVMTFNEFAQRYVESRGYDKAYAFEVSQRALGALAAAKYGDVSAEQFFYALEKNNREPSPQFLAAKTKVERSLQDPEVAKLVNDTLKETGHGTEGVVGLDSLSLSLLTGDVANAKDVLTVLPPDAIRYVFEHAAEHKLVLDTIASAMDSKNGFLMRFAEPQAIAGGLRDAQATLEKFAALKEEFKQAEDVLLGLTRMSPDGYFQALSNTQKPPSSLDYVFGQTKELAEIGWKNFKYIAQTVGQRARENPANAAFYGRSWELANNIRQMFHQSILPIGMKLDGTQRNGELTKETIVQSNKVIGSPKLMSVVDQWCYWTAKEAQTTGIHERVPETHSEVAKLLATLSPNERVDVVTFMNNIRAMTASAQSLRLEAMLKISAHNAATVVAPESGLKMDLNIKLSQELLKALSADFTKQENVVSTNAKVAEIQSKLSPEAFNTLLTFAQGEMKQWRLWQDYFVNNPDWMTARRMERYVAEVWRGKELVLLQASSIKEMQQKMQKPGITKRGEIVDQWKKDDLDAMPLGMDAEPLITRLRELEQNQLEFVKAKGTVSQEGFADFIKYSPVTQITREYGATQQMPAFETPARTLSKGAQELPWFWNHLAWAQRQASYWSRQLYRAQSRAHILDPEVAVNPELQKEFRTYRDNTLQQDPRWAQAITRFTAGWFLPFNLANTLLNAGQSYVTHASELTSMTGKPLESYSRIRNTMDILIRANQGKGYANPEHEWFQRKLTERGEVGFSQYDEDMMHQDAMSVNYFRLLGKHKPKDLGQYAASAGGAYVNAGMAMFKATEQLNSRMTQAAFDVYREQGLTREQALEKAIEYNHAVNYNNQRSQRPIGLASGRDSATRGAFMLATSLMSYTMGATWQTIRYFERGFFRAKGLTPSESYNARKAALQMIVTQLALAGTLGIPGVSALLTLVNQLDPKLEINKVVRENVARLFQEDGENGSPFTSMAMSGIPSMLGWDMQSRLSMGNNIPGVNEFNGFQPEQLLGPPVGMVSSWLTGTKRLVGGDTGGLASFVPPAFRKAVVLLANGGRMEDYRDRPIFEPTPGEMLGSVIGFQPKRLTDFNVADRMVKQHEQVEGQRMAQFHQRLAADTLKGNFGSVRQALLAQQQQNPAYKPINGARAVAQAAEDLTFPRDLRYDTSKGVAQDRSRILGLFQLDPLAMSETGRLTFRRNLLSRLGVPQTPEPSQEREAELVDELHRANPLKTRAELKLLAQTVLKRTSRTATLLPEWQ